MVPSGRQREGRPDKGWALLGKWTNHHHAALLIFITRTQSEPTRCSRCNGCWYVHLIPPYRGSCSNKHITSHKPTGNRQTCPCDAFSDVLLVLLDYRCHSWVSRLPARTVHNTRSGRLLRMIVFHIPVVIPQQWKWVALFFVIGFFGYGTQVSRNLLFNIST